jgi:hypothetical protein
LRRLPDECPAAPERLDRARQDELVGEDRPLVHHAVAVGVLDHHDVVDRLVRVLAGRIRHETRHLEDPHAAVRIEVNRDRIDDERLAGNELDMVARRHHDRLLLLSCRQRRRLLRCLAHCRWPSRTVLKSLDAAERGGAPPARRRRVAGPRRTAFSGPAPP